MEIVSLCLVPVERGREALQFSFPTEIAYNAKNRMMYVVEGWNHRVQILNSDLTFSSTLGKNGSSSVGHWV